MINRLLILAVFILESITYVFWLGCQKITDKFHFSSLDAQLKLDEVIRNDVGYSTQVARFFHNKVNVYGSELFNKYIQFWDIRFMSLFVSIIGCFGIAYGFWHLLTKKNKTYKTWLVLGFLLLIPFIEVIQFGLPYSVRISIILFSFALFSLFGIWQFLKRYKKVGLLIVVILLAISIWHLIVFQKDIFNNFCYN